MQQVFGALRDGYRAEVDRFFGGLWTEMRGLESSSPHQFRRALERMNQTLSIWLTGMGERLQRDLVRATEAIVEERTGSAERAEALLTPQRKAGWPEAPRLTVAPLEMLPSRAQRTGWLWVIGVLCAVWVPTFFFLTPPADMWGYAGGGALAIITGYVRYRNIRRAEGVLHVKRVRKELLNASRSVASGVEAYVVDWVRRHQSFMAMAAQHPDANGQREKGE